MSTTCEKEQYLQRVLESAEAYDEANKKTTIYEKMHGHDARVLNGLHAQEDEARNSYIQALRVFSDLILRVDRTSTPRGGRGG